MGGRKKAQANGEGWTLTPQQDAAVDLLCSGKTLTDTAATLAIRRQTVSAWVNHDPGFAAALNSRRQELWDGAAERLRGMLPAALDVLAEALDGDQPLAAAIHILKACGLYGGIPAPQGPTEPAEAAITQKRRDYDRLLAELAASP